MPSEFVHLHVHTEYSLLDGQSRIDDLMKRAKELEMPAVGISDHGVMFGVIDFYRAAKKAGIKPVLGMEAYLAPRQRTDKDSVLDKKPFHMLLFAKNNTGYKNLMKLASIAQLEGYYYRPRIDWETLEQYREGIIATSGCLAAEIPKLVEDGKDAEARAKIGKYLEVFGEDNFYLELQPHKIEQLVELNKWIVDYRKSNHTNVQVYASNDVHYVRQSDWEAHDTLLCIQTGALKHEENRMRMEPHDSYFMKSSGEMREEFLKHGMPEAMIKEAFANSLKIAEMTDVNLDEKGYHLPIFPVPPEFEGDSAKYLRYLCEMGLEWRFPGGMSDPVLVERLNYELDVIGGMGFNTYFLIVWDLCEFAREADIWWNVRGSGAGSLVAYSLGITNIDPIQNSLLFERFLNAGRVSMPDIDLDYPDDRRGEMIAYAVDKYGKDKVAAIITFGTMGAKASVKDVGRALDVDLGKINSVTSLIPQDAKQKQLQEYIDANPELQDKVNKDPEIKKVMDAAIQLQGLTRHASTHAAGVIIGDRPLDEYTPLHRVTGTDPSGGSLEAVTQFPMETAESIGLLKVDFLGLSTLTILRKACDLINKHHGTNYTMDNVPYRHDDSKQKLTAEQLKMLDETFEMCGRGETIGVFQVESGGMQEMLRGMRPQKFEHIIAGISLYRPGPMDFIPTYNKRLHGDEEVPYKHESLRPILAETYGVITYQEQIMQIARECFGYERSEADLMRRAVSKKKAEDLAKHKDIFKTRGPENGIPVDVAEAIFDEIEFFANYGFNKCLVSSTEIVDSATGRIVTIGDLYNQKASVGSTLSLNTDSLRLQDGVISDVMFNGVKPVFRLTTQTGREIVATGNHPFYSFDGWQNLEDLQVGDRVAVPRRIQVEGKKAWDSAKINEFVAGFYDLDELPNDIFELNNTTISEILAKLQLFWFESREIFHISTIKPRIARQVQHLLLRIGILSEIQIVHIHADKPLENSFVWEIAIQGEKNLSLALEKLGKNLPQNIRKKISHRLPVTTNGEVLLLDKEPEDIYWDKIESIEYIGEEETYDLTIEGTHNFVANDIIVHNSHAADYAVITVQTAFLKCHYPAEYMTALLTVQFDTKEKVATFLAECRRLQIPVLPPHVNNSAIDFDIEITDTGKRGIRFGMGAIKNAGVGATQIILDERQKNGKFANLMDFCQRVDLRQVGKRAVESLIKVGAFEGWGERDDLLYSLERIIGYSGDYHKAKEVGQKSLFGDVVGSSESLDIPEAPTKEKVSRRLQLKWEKDLMGLYVSGRPVDKHVEKFNAMGNLQIISQLKDPEMPYPTEQIKLAGEVVSIKKLVTKNNEAMAIVLLEDWHETAAQIEVVMFPKSWKQVRDYVSNHKLNNSENPDESQDAELKEGDILLVMGKVDKSKGDAQILCDKVSFEFEMMTATEIAQTMRPHEASWMNGNGYHGSHEEPPLNLDFDEETGEVVRESLPALPPIVNRDEPKYLTQELETPAIENPFGDISGKQQNGREAVHIRVHFQRSSDTGRDRRRLRRIHATMMEYPGKDSFSIVLEGGAKASIMDFPNHHTGICDALMQELEDIVGAGNVHVEDKSVKH